MKLPGIAFGLAAIWLGAWVPAFAQATAPVDYARHNEAFASAAGPVRDARLPVADRVFDEAPRAFAVSTPETSPLGERRAPIALEETRAKSVQAPASSRPEAPAPVMSRLDGRRARISTADDAVKPRLVGKYQDALSSGGSVQVGRLPALAPGASATINRFVFRHNNPVPAPADATPAAGGAVPRR